MNAPFTTETQRARYAIEDEMALLGSFFTYQDVSLYRTAAAIVTPDDFSDPFYARLFHWLGEGIEQGLSNFPLIAWVLAKARNDETFVGLGVSTGQFVINMRSYALPAIGVEGGARQVRFNRLEDRLHGASASGDLEGAQQAAAEMQRLSKAHLTKDDSVRSLGEVALDVVNELNEAYQTGELRDDTAWPGSAVLADVMGGWRRGRLYVLGGRPGMGKSTLGLHLALHTALKGHGVAFFALEMSMRELAEMAACNMAFSDGRRIEYRDLQISAKSLPHMGPRIEAVNIALGRFNNLPLRVIDRAGLTLAEIRAQASQYAAKLAGQGKRLDLIVVDHLGLMRATDTYRGNKVAETEEISNGLKALAKELQCAVLALAQLNRGVEGRDDKKPDLSDLRNSGAIEQDADVVMFAYREAYYLRKPCEDPDDEMKRRLRLDDCKNKLDLIFAKHRGGPTPALEFFCDMGCAVVRDLEDRHG